MSKAIVAKVTSVMEIPGADKIHVAVVLGENCIVSKDVGVGYVGLLFPADTQLSEQYCHENNLFRHATENKDPEKTGFFETNRRVRVQPFLKVKSTAYFASLDSISYAQIPGKVYDIGYSFDEIDGKPICNKYISQATRDSIAKQNRPKMAKASVMPYFEKHVDSAQFKHNAAMIPIGALLSFHAKVHGTSHRSSYTKVVKELPKWKQLVNKIAPVFSGEEWKHVVGTRNVILTEGKEGFHGSEQFRFDVMESLKPYMSKGMTVYGEIAGYANGKPIMAVHSGKAAKDKSFLKKYGENIVYKYGCGEHEYRFHVYRITQLTQDGVNVDLSQKQLEQWCADRGILGPVDVASAKKQIVKLEMSDDYLNMARDVWRAVKNIPEPTINIAGNGIYTLQKQGWTQEKVNRIVHDILAKVHEHHPVKKIVSGGQSGVDLAGGVAAYKLGIDCEMTLPKGFIIRFQNGKDYEHSEDFVRELVVAYAVKL